jgi:hypothetical protein
VRSDTRLAKTLVLGFATGALVGIPAQHTWAQVHGFVEPCQISFLEDNQTECELCEPVAGTAKHCETELESRGYAFKCRTTPGHSKPAEVWCAPKKRAQNEIEQWIFSGLATVVLAVAFVLTRRARRRTKRSGRSR